MDLLWTETLVGVTGGLAVFGVAALFLGKVATEKIADTATTLVEDRLRRAEESHKSVVAFASAVDTDLRTRRIPIYTELWRRPACCRCGPGRTKT